MALTCKLIPCIAGASIEVDCDSIADDHVGIRRGAFEKGVGVVRTGVEFDGIPMCFVIDSALYFVSELFIWRMKGSYCATRRIG